MSQPEPRDFGEPIRILSDLHLAHPGCRIGKVAQLRPLLEGARTVLFNGDTFELRKEALVGRSQAMRAELEELCGEVGAAPVFMTGNHDPEISEYHHFDLCGGQVFLTHGDILYEDVSPWSRLIERMHEVLEEIRAEYPPDYLDDLELRLRAAKRIAAETRARAACRPGRLAKLRTILMEVWPPTRPLKILMTWARSHHLAHRIRDRFRPEARFIIHGHTHRAIIHEAKGKVAINTGAFLPVSKALVVDIAGGMLTVVPVAQRRGSFRADTPGRSWELEP